MEHRVRRGVTGSELLLGRRTYAEMERGWRHGPADNPFTAIMNAAPKYVVSRTLTGPLDWRRLPICWREKPSRPWGR